MGTSCTKTGGTAAAPSGRDPIVAFTDLNLLHAQHSTAVGLDDGDQEEEVVVHFPAVDTDSLLGGPAADGEKQREEAEVEVDPLGAAIRSPPVASIPAISRLVSPDASRPTTPREKREEPDNQTLGRDPLIPFAPPAIHENPEARIRQWLDDHLAVRIKKSPLSATEQEEALRRGAKGNTVGKLAVSSVYGLSSSSGGAANGGGGPTGTMGPASRATTSLLQSQQGLSQHSSFQMAQLQRLNSVADEIVCELKQEDESEVAQAA